MAEYRPSLGYVLWEAIHAGWTRTRPSWAEMSVATRAQYQRAAETIAAQVRVETLREAGHRVLHEEDEMPEDKAAGLWMVVVHGGDTERPEDWQEAFAVAHETRTINHT